MKKILFVVLFTSIAFSQAQAAIMINTLNCGSATVNGQYLLGVGYKVQIISNSSMMGTETKFYLLSQVVVPNAPEHRTELVFQGEDMGWLKFLGADAVVLVSQGHDKAIVELSSGAKATCH